MTDRIDTPADLVATLATISESLNTTAMPTLDNIEAQLLPLLDDAEARNDQQAITLIQGTYARAQELINVAQASRENAATAVDLAQTFRNQRDDIAKELDELTEAVEHIDTTHPAVAQLAEYIEEDIYEYQEYAMRDTLAEAHSEGQSDLRGEMCWWLQKLLVRDYEQVDCLIDVLEGHYTPDAEQIAMLQKLIDSLYANRPISDKFGLGSDPDGWNDDEEIEDEDDE